VFLVCRSLAFNMNMRYMYVVFVGFDRLVGFFFHCASSRKQQSVDRHVAPREHITNFKVFDLTQSGLESTIHHTPP
jgi:hypothetical protein